MASKKNPEPSPTALAVLVLLQEAPMHPYRMWHLIKNRGKDEVINVRQRTSLYQTIDRLLRSNLIVIQETEQEERRPERTIYAITDSGRRTALVWLKEMLSDTGNRFPPFPAALAHLPLLPPEEAAAALEQRASRLQEEINRIKALLETHGSTIPRLFLIESEYQRAMLKAEFAWVTELVTDLRYGRLTWSEEWLRDLAAQMEPESR